MGKSGRGRAADLLKTTALSSANVAASGHRYPSFPSSDFPRNEGVPGSSPGVGFKLRAGWRQREGRPKAPRLVCGQVLGGSSGWTLHPRLARKHPRTPWMPGLSPGSASRSVSTIPASMSSCWALAERAIVSAWPGKRRRAAVTRSPGSRTRARTRCAISSPSLCGCSPGRLASSRSYSVRPPMRSAKAINGSWIWRGAWTHSRSRRLVAERAQRGEEKDFDRCRHRRGAARGLRRKQLAARARGPCRHRHSLIAPASLTGPSRRQSA